ncbi:MAG: hypothetical protein ACLTMP_01530 [Eggerthella lenta]
MKKIIGPPPRARHCCSPPSTRPSRTGKLLHDPAFVEIAHKARRPTP